MTMWFFNERIWIGDLREKNFYSLIQFFLGWYRVSRWTCFRLTFILWWIRIYDKCILLRVLYILLMDIKEMYFVCFPFSIFYSKCKYFFLSIDGNFRYQCHSIFINIRLIFFSSSNKLRFGEIIQKKNRELKIKMMSGQIYLTIHRKFVFSINIIKLD